MNRVYDSYEKLLSGFNLSDEFKRKLIFKITNKYHHVNKKFVIGGCDITELEKMPEFPSLYLEKEGLFKFFIMTPTDKSSQNRFFRVSFEVKPRNTTV